MTTSRVLHFWLGMSDRSLLELRLTVALVEVPHGQSSETCGSSLSSLASSAIAAGQTDSAAND
jgi:hypothetical protein